jgi:hypothetical protein
MRIALAYSTKDQVELSRQTLPVLIGDDRIDLYWCDGSRTEEGQNFLRERRVSRNPNHCEITADIRGGADAAIAWKLTRLLKTTAEYVGLIENDVLLDPDWLEPTMELFEKGKQDGLDVGTVSPRSYVDRVLIQRDGYAVMHNIGAGAIIFTRQAAQLALDGLRTHWWPDNVRLFAQISSIDLRTYACFRGQDQFVTTDWGWEAQLARHGLASLALTPARCQMVGQVPSLQEQGLTLCGHADGNGRFPIDIHLPRYNDPSFETYRDTLANIRQGKIKLDGPNKIHRSEGGMLFFPHQLGYLAGGPSWQGTTELKWSQCFGPFAYRAGLGGASLSVRVSGSCSFLVTGGLAGSKVDIRDTRSGFKFVPDLPPEGDNPISINVPGGPVPRQVTMDMSEGAVFYGLQTSEPQMLDTTFRFSWDQLPEAK